MDHDELNHTLKELQAELAQRLLEKLRSGKATAADFNVARRLCVDFGIDSRAWEQDHQEQRVSEMSGDDLPVFDDLPAFDD